MKEITRNRTIRPSTRGEKSNSYKIDTRTVSRGDILVVNIDHETRSFRKTYKFHGSDVANKDSISFRVKEYGTSIEISWSGATPMDTALSKSEKSSKLLANKSAEVPVSPKINASPKMSFDPISNADSAILVLGTMPGEKSLEVGEYYGHPRNRFWKVISAIVGQELPETYAEKKALLLKTKIAIWDVAYRANRKGSLDSAIENEEPNDLKLFIERHKNLKVVAFNGVKSEALFDKHFDRKSSLKFITLPSTSPANTRIDFDNMCKIWRQILIR